MVRIAVRACAALFLTASTLAAEPPRGAMPVGDGDQPRRTVLEYCAVNADRVVVGKVVGIAQPAKIEFAQPYGDGKSAPRWAATCMVEVSETLADRTAASGPASAATRTATIKVLFDRPDPDAPPPTGGSPFYLDPQEGGEYVLLLQKMLQRDEFYLPARTACLQKADPAAVAAVKAALDIDKWPWGETVAGLQLAAVVAPLPYSDAPQGLPDGSQRMMICLAMRNTSTKPIHVFVYALDVTVSGVATNADGQSVKLKDANVRNLQLMHIN